MLNKFIVPLTLAASVFVQPAALAQTATYYSDYYQGRQTASGEIFDTWSNTAAHPNLPFGTWVQVTNLNNGASVNVRINDRCSCGIDLSKAAAQQIGLLQSGVAPVSIQVLR
ncbi:septal ring lytic transglycosylase RlpA family protein [Acaryochloris sp. IP29b_bin.137]|uniref:septal ring lytic transglycosylase RlpA family protein n=1 Tax=Acaryochloris sp. IP29b_bin.137 TaxID=2969217 RepID=UPI00261D2D33|nr:septal ring lytic transglycosylase RlpA family protein [Acaryochloris sp. IP29b_bin.137]